MRYITAFLAFAGAAVAAPAPAPGPACPVEPVSFEITDFHFQGQTGPVILETYNFNVSGNVGPSTTSCSAVSAGTSGRCQVAFRDIEPTACGDSGFTFSFLGSDETDFVLQVNYTVGAGCPTLTGSRVFPAYEVQCVPAETVVGRTVFYEDLVAPTSFTLEATVV